MPLHREVFVSGCTARPRLLWSGFLAVSLAVILVLAAQHVWALREMAAKETTCQSVGIPVPTLCENTNGIWLRCPWVRR